LRSQTLLEGGIADMDAIDLVRIAAAVLAALVVAVIVYRRKKSSI
jgi:hypothetical protein